MTSDLSYRPPLRLARISRLRSAWLGGLARDLGEGSAGHTAAIGVEVPRGVEMTTLLFALSAKRQRQRQWDQAAESMKELGETLAKRAIESDKRQQQLVDLFNRAWRTSLRTARRPWPGRRSVT